MTKRWSNGQSQFIENPKIDAFLAAVEAVCKEHGFEIGHEDGQGAFEVWPYGYGSWLEDAHDCTEDPRLQQ